MLHAEDIGVGIARAIRAARVRPSGRRLPRPAGQAVLADHGRRGRRGLADQGGRSGAAPDPGARRRAARARPAQEREEAADPARQGRGLCAGRRRHPRAGREDRHPLPADVDGQGPAARHARAVGLGRALLRAARGRRGDAGRRAPELAAVARQGQDLGRQGPQGRGGQKFIQIDISPTEIDSNVRIDAPLVGDIGSCVAALLAGMGPAWAEPAGRVAERDRRAQEQEHRQDGRDAGARTRRR